MKKRYVALLCIAFFLAGSFFTRFLIQPEIDMALDKVNDMNASILKGAEIQILSESEIALKTELKIIRISLKLIEKGAPSTYIMENHISILSERINGIKSTKKFSDFDYPSKEIDLLIIDAETLISDIKFSL